MRRILLLAIVALIVSLLTVPAFAALRVISDTFDRGSETGVAIVQVSDNLFAEIAYRDMDGSQGFTVRDQRLKVRYFRRSVRLPRLPFGPVQLERG